jgi:cob(I)alamin adenosyltransferase
MPKGARTKADLELAVDVLKARDARRAREQLAAACATVHTVSPAANSTGLPSGHRAGTALDRARSFLRRLFARPV